ncbi:Hypothetical protein LUCI_2615 [Lucifera butyrica]|uniref:Transcription regulator hth arac- type n=1 Tax=Lucifera butyrica TaxID=1351585 RepID=A0A498R7K9_9FIRM|nr:response regulator [Lucifera butyrica]VBB07371.1 Hypothetical protein LUCI_2615 [Lucifera butyrica]
MFKVLLVDDDFTARTNVKTMIDWEQNGFVLCGEATNGQTAIQLIQDELPDIVITDMSMPLLDGVELIEYIAATYPDMKTVALSGYDDFDYVKNSLKNGAVDYLLKHRLDSTSLLEVLKSASEQINRKHRLMEQLVRSREILQHDLIRQLVLGNIRDKTGIKAKIKELELPVEDGSLSLAVVAIDDFRLIKERFTETEVRGLIASLADLTEEILQDMGHAVMSFVDDGKFIILFSFGNIRSELYIYNHVGTTVNRIRASIKRYLNITACFSLGRSFYKISDMDRFYKEANEKLNEKMIAGRDRIFREPANLKSTVDFFNLDLKDEKQIMLAVKARDMTRVSQELTVIFDRIAELGVSYKSIQMICVELIGVANRIARESSLDIQEIYSNKDIPYEEMKKHETIIDVKEWICGVYERLIQLLPGADINPNYTEPTRKAVAYIWQNYARAISLNQAAEHIGVNSSYLSRIFKEDCGTGFAEYLNNIRVKQAQYLMERTDTKLKEIVSQVGFNNYTYFFKVFKMVVGITPLEYKEKCQRNA